MESSVKPLGREYSVTSLARISGVSVRTLHYYDEIGLLVPFIRMENGRRYYRTQQLLVLQEILYFKEIGFSLEKIKAILKTKNLNKCAIISSQKEMLIKEISRLGGLVRSMGKRISHYKDCKITPQEIRQQEDGYKKHMQEFEQLCVKSFKEEHLDGGEEKEQEISKEDMGKIVERAAIVMKKLMAAMQDNLSEASDAVHILMQEYCRTSMESWSKQALLLWRDNFHTNSDLSQLFEKQYPNLREFLYKAMASFIARTFPE